MALGLSFFPWCFFLNHSCVVQVERGMYLFFQPISVVFRAHAFQTVNGVLFYKKFLYESCLKIKLIHFLKKINKYLINHALMNRSIFRYDCSGWNSSRKHSRSIFAHTGCVR
jgi:hypothetical protein